jgi:hypothetical protein
MKITKDKLKQIIKEEIGGMPQYPGNGVMPGYGYMMNAPKGQLPDNRTYEPYQGSEPHETGPVQTHIEGGVVYVTQGKNLFQLVFDNDNLTSGHVIPVGEYKFTIEAGMITWFDNTPANVRFDADLEKQIMDFSGREK